MLVRTDRRYRLAAAPPAVWEALARTEHYQRWWPWLRELDAGELEVGARWDCVVQPPLPYSVRFEILLTELEEGRFAGALVGGDINGTARLELEPAHGGTDLRLRSNLAPAGCALRAFGLLARPVVRWGHDWVLDTGFRQFAAHAIDGAGHHPE